MPSRQRNKNKGPLELYLKQPTDGLNEQASLPSALPYSPYISSLWIWSGPGKSAFTATEGAIKEENSQRKLDVVSP